MKSHETHDFYPNGGKRVPRHLPIHTSGYPEYTGVDRPILISVVKDRVWSAGLERWFRWIVRSRERIFRRILHKRDYDPAKGFFDTYPRFFLTSKTSPEPNRLNQRHRALIQSNADIIRGRRVLDIASHDGRWSFAANKAGAEHVLGIEVRQHLIEMAQNNMREYAVPQGTVEFIRGDVLTELDRFGSGRFDTVLCFGFLYHSVDHMLLLRKIARLRPMNLVIDTAITTYPGTNIEIYDEAIQIEGAGAVGDPGDTEWTVVGLPSRRALELMLRAAGFSVVRYYDWRQASIKCWADLKDYYLGTRLSLTAAGGWST